MIIYKDIDEMGDYILLLKATEWTERTILCVCNNTRELDTAADAVGCALDALGYEYRMINNI